MPLKQNNLSQDGVSTLKSQLGIVMVKFGLVLKRHKDKKINFLFRSDLPKKHCGREMQPPELF